MTEGKRLCDDPSNPLRDKYPIPFELTIENGTCFIAVFSAIRVLKIALVLYPFPIGQFSNNQKE